jgi:DNA-binding response OmpR family regulator
MKRARVLVVDDEAAIRSFVTDLLERAGYEVLEAASGEEGLRVLYALRPDLVLLDVSMPGLDGWGALERIRDLTDVPVLMLSGMTGELEKVRGLKSGADDYVTKPFGPQELLARVAALLRRAPARDAPHETYADGLIALDVTRRTASIGGRELSLTPREFRLLVAFVRHRNQLLTHGQLLELVWGDEYGVSREQVKLYVSYLRRKIRAAGIASEPIETVRGFGYRYRPAQEARA